MSFNHENVVWQNKDGLWGIGFYERISTGQSTWDDDYDEHGYDPEWDDDYNYDTFMFASTGHRTQQQAINSWRGANPGSHTVYSHNRANAKEIAEFEDMAKASNNPAYAKLRADRIAKKEVLALRKRVREAIRKAPPVAYSRYSVSISKNQTFSATGWTETHTATLHPVGDWLVLKSEKVLKSGKRTPVDVKVWNTKTKTPGPMVLSIRAVSRWA